MEAIAREGDGRQCSFLARTGRPRPIIRGPAKTHGGTDDGISSHCDRKPAEILSMSRMMFPKMFVRACEIIQILGAGGLVAVPSYAELKGPAAADVATYAQAANADAPTRVKLFRLAFDAAVSSFSGRQQLYERYYSGDPVRLAGALYALYDKDAPIARIHEMLNQLERLHKTG